MLNFNMLVHSAPQEKLKCDTAGRKNGYFIPFEAYMRL